MDNMRRRLLQLSWIVLMVSWRCAVFAGSTQPPVVTVEAKANGQIDPSSLEIFSTTLDGGNFAESTNEYDKTEIIEDIRGTKDMGQEGSNTQTVENPQEKLQALEKKGHHTTKRSTDWSRSDIESLATAIDETIKQSGNGDSLFLDMDMASSNIVPKLVPLTGESAAKVAVKDGNRESRGGDTSEELLDLSPQSQIREHLNVVTEISVREKVGDQIIMRRPTSDELRLVQNKISTSSLEDNDIFGQDHSNHFENNGTIPNDTIAHVNTDVEDLASFLKSDSAFADDADDTDPFGDWDDNDDINDMELILKDDEFETPSEHDGDGEEKVDQEDNNKQPGVMEKEPGDGDYRKIYHTERQNFSNVKEFKIVISETEGDFFDDDDNFSGAKSSQQPEVSKQSGNAENSTDTSAASATTTIPTTGNGDNTVDSSNPIGDFKGTETKAPTDSISGAGTTDLPNSTDNPSFVNKTRNITLTDISSPKNISITQISVRLQKNETSNGLPTINGDGVVTESDMLAENGVSIKDFSEITSLVENSYHEVKNADNSNDTIAKDNVGNDANNNSSVSIRLSKEVTHKITAVNSTFEEIDDNDDEVKSTTATVPSTIPGDISTVQINMERSDFTTIIPELSTISTKLRFTGVADEVTQTTTKDATTTNNAATLPPEKSSAKIETLTTRITTTERSTEYTSATFDTTSAGSQTTLPNSFIAKKGNSGRDHELTPAEVDPLIQVNATREDERYDFLQIFPLVKARVLNNSAEFSVKISQKDHTFFVPESAHVYEDGTTINITWKANDNLNNSVAMKIFEKDDFHMIKEIVTNLFTGNELVTQQKAIAFNPDPVLDDTMPGRTRVVMMRDGTYVTFSNVDFLKKKNFNATRENSDASTRDPKLWHFEVASICIATVVVIAIILYVIAIKTKAKIVLREKDELPQENQRLCCDCIGHYW